MTWVRPWRPLLVTVLTAVLICGPVVGRAANPEVTHPGTTNRVATNPSDDRARVETSPTVDLVLTHGGVLRGYVVDGQGVPQPRTDIRLRTAAGEAFEATSDQEGRFGYRGLRGGSYVLETDFGVVACRAWPAASAPPSAAATLLVVHDAELARGQHAASPVVNRTVGRMKKVMTNPFAVAAIVGAAVAIPVAIANADDDDNS